jgi:hypothetical protein
LRRNYPIVRLEKAAFLARQEDMNLLINKTKREAEHRDKVFPITFYHRQGNNLREIIKKNWDMLGN